MLPATWETVDCVVVGAGAAGIACARGLGAQGHQVVVLEAAQRIGGRCCTDTSFGELGAEFIHGSTVCTRALSESAGLRVLDIRRFQQLRWGTPALLRDQRVDKIYQVLRTLEMEPELLPPEVSLLDYARVSQHSVTTGNARHTAQHNA
jgi:phytoene dehydrogenase-like protein